MSKPLVTVQPGDAHRGQQHLEVEGHRFSFVAFHPKDPKKVFCVEINNFVDLQEYILKDPNSIDSAEKESIQTQEDRLAFLSEKKEKERNRPTVVKKKEKPAITPSKGKNPLQNIGERLGDELAAEEIAHEKKQKPEKDGRRPSHLLLDTKMYGDEDEITDVKFGDPIKLEVKLEERDEDQEDFKNLALSLWDTSSSTPIQVKEVMFKGRGFGMSYLSWEAEAEEPFSISFTEDGSQILFGYRKFEDENIASNVCAILDATSLEIQDTISFEKEYEDDSCSVVHFALPQPDILYVAFKELYDKSYKHTFIVKKDGEWDNLGFAQTELATPSNLLFNSKDAGKAFGVVLHSSEDDSEISEGDDTEQVYRFGYYDLEKVKANEYDVMPGGVSEKEEKSEKDSDNPYGSEDDYSSEEDSFGHRMTKTHVFKTKSEIVTAVANRDMSRVFLITEDNQEAYIFNPEDGTLELLTFGTQFKLRENSHLFNDFVGSYLDQFSQKQIANFSKLAAGESNIQILAANQVDDREVFDYAYIDKSQTFRALSGDERGINVDTLALTASKKENSAVSQQIREISNYKWMHPYLVYCKGSSEIIVRDVHRPNNKIVLPLQDFFICFVDLEKNVLKAGGLTGKNAREGEKEADFNSDTESEGNDASEQEEESYQEEESEEQEKEEGAVAINENSDNDERSQDGELRATTKSRKSKKLWRKVKKSIVVSGAENEEEDHFVAEPTKIMQHSVSIGFLTLNKKGYQLNVLKLQPYRRVDEQQAFLFKSEFQWKSHWMTQEQPIEAFIFKAAHCGKGNAQQGTVLVAQYKNMIEMLSLVSGFKHVSKLKAMKKNPNCRMVMQRKDLCTNISANKDKETNEPHKNCFQVIYAKHEKEIGGSKIKVLDIHHSVKDPQYNLLDLPGSYILRMTMLNETTLLWLDSNLNFNSAEVKRNGKKTLLGPRQEWQMINADRESLMKKRQEFLSNPLGIRMSVSGNNTVHLGNWAFRIFKQGGSAMDTHNAEIEGLGNDFFHLDEDEDSPLIDGPLTSASAPNGYLSIYQESYNGCMSVQFNSYYDEKQFQICSAKAKFSSFVETDEAGHEKILTLIGNRFFIMSPQGEILHETQVKYASGNEFALYQPHVIRTSPKMSHLLIYDQQTKRQFIFKFENDDLHLVKKLDPNAFAPEEIVFRAATQIDDDGNVWQVVYDPNKEYCNKFKVIVNQDTGTNFTAGIKNPEGEVGFPRYFVKFMESKNVYEFDKSAQLSLSVLENYLAIAATDKNSEVYAIPINRESIERKGEFIKLDLPVSNEWDFHQIEPCIAPNRVQVFFYNLDADLSSLLIWDLEKNLEDRQVQVRKESQPRRGMHSPLSYCDGAKHFYDVEYSMELAHFDVPSDFERLKTSNEVVFSEGKDLMINRLKDKGVRVICSISELQKRMIEAATSRTEELIQNSLPATFTQWRCVDGSNIFHVLSTNIKCLNKFNENFEKYIETVDPDQRENVKQLLFMQILYPDNNGVSPFDVAMKQSSQYVDIMLQMLIKVEDSSMSRYIFKDLKNFQTLLAMDLTSFEDFLGNCFFQPKNLQTAQIRIWEPEDDSISFMLNTSLLTNSLMKKTIGATEGDLLDGSDDEEPQAIDDYGEEDVDAPPKATQQSGVDTNRATATEDMLKSFKKGKKKQLTKQEMQEKLEAKQAELENWQYFDKTRDKRMELLEPTFKKKNKFGVIPKEFMNDERMKQLAEKGGDQFKELMNDDDDEEFKRIELKVLEFDWVFRGDSAKMFIEELATTPNDNIFTVESIQTSIRFLWDFYQPEIIKKIYIPYMVYFLSFVLYASAIYGSQFGEYGPKYLFAIYCIGYSGYILFMEFKQFLDQGRKYFEMPSFMWNLLDIVSSNLVIFFLVLDVVSGFTTFIPEVYIRIIAATAAFLLWLKFFTFLRVFNNFSAFIRMIIEMMRDMSTFLSMLVLGILSFANTYYILDQTTFQEKQDWAKTHKPGDPIPTLTGGTFFDSFTYTYRMGLGDFDTDAFAESKFFMFFWLLFFACTLFIQILLLNLLIAIMGDTFERVQEMKEQAQLRENCALIADNWFLLNREKVFGNAKYIIVAQLEKADGENKGAWDGKLAAIKGAFDRASKSIESNVQKVKDGTKTELDSVVRRIEGQFLQSETQVKGFQSQVQSQIKELQNQQAEILAALQTVKKSVEKKKKKEDEPAEEAKGDEPAEGDEGKKKKKDKKKDKKKKKEEAEGDGEAEI